MPSGKLPPSNSPAREALRQKGQFWTPDWVADAMLAYVARQHPAQIFDPAVGAGAFLLAAKRRAAHTGQFIRLAGTEIDPAALEQARANGLSEQDLAGIVLHDFTHYAPAAPLEAIIANPPYIRHHRLDKNQKEHLRHLAQRATGYSIDGRAGLHVYFLIHALTLLAPAGRLAFIVPADICEGVFAHDLWQWIGRQYCLEAIVTFAPQATPFPNVDTNPIILLIKNVSPAPEFRLAVCPRPDTPDLLQWIKSDFEHAGELKVETYPLQDSILKGLTRLSYQTSAYVLGDFARVMRGIATGANDYFFLTKKQVEALNIPDEFLKRAIGRTRDVLHDAITVETLEALEAAGRPTYLFAPDGRPLAEFPPNVQAYLRQGEQSGLPAQALIAQRRPWYRMEQRIPPPFLFAYLGRRNTRFIRNLAQVVPLTGFLCVYPHKQAQIQKLWHILNDERTIQNLASVGKSYGSGAIKVEPRALEKLPLPEDLVLAADLAPLQQQDVYQAQFCPYQND